MDPMGYTGLTSSSLPTISHSTSPHHPSFDEIITTGNHHHRTSSSRSSIHHTDASSLLERGPDAMTLREHASDSMLSKLNFSWSNPRSQRLGIFAACAVAVLVFLTLLSHASEGGWGMESDVLSIPKSNITVSAAEEEEQLINAYLKHIARPSPNFQVNTSHFAPHGWIGFDLPQGKTRHWTKPLGKDLCIFDFDNRDFNKTGQIWADELMTWNKPNKVHGLSLGILNHWLYAKIHGYKYYYIDIEPFADGRRASWKKPILIPALLDHHSTCIFMDSDAIFPHLDLPFEWIMNHFALDPTVDVLAMAIDPDKPYNKDRTGKLYLNTGFIIAQDQPKTREIMDEWRVCPEEGGRHPECTAFKKQMFNVTDQGGFGTFIRYDFEGSVRHLPCKEANGFPQSETECQGELISHLWTGKDSWIKDKVGGQVTGDLLEALHGLFRRDAEAFRLRESVVLGDVLEEEEEGGEGDERRRWWED
ncbi:unnamed protein product [Zymoseptoria tritici ST99CH_1A5]|nr:unnamed protein product [Zymoseptoria tritici ST99CH_1E4]SMR49340.1 unnamed protein product [Zymoseptoria tritici ST99CH_3D1]SMY22040.1 unnamed protein product [Zymoseptoria tritici ST99CH_1A5]